jgi:glycosyltransferase involved in cell wall biosynthesis
VVLLNPDTLLPPGWLQRLVAAGYATGDTGSVTPLTNQGTIVSYPLPNADNESPDLAGTDRLDAVIRAANGRGRLALPTAVGFCMFIRHDCLAEVGLFREDAFAQGYGEENDWSLRANHLGWRHFAATGLFVAHLGGRSFGPGRRHLLARNSQVLNRLHPGYDAMVAAFSARDPLWPARFRADARRWAPNTPGQRAVILITHDAGGGVARFVAERCEQLSAEGRRPIVLRPVVPKPHEPNTGPMPSVAPADKLGCRVFDGCADEYPNLRFHLPEELDDLTAFLQADDPEAVEFHHLLGHAAEIMTLAARLKLPYRVFIHDYSYWCPRITLCTKGPRYCGEPLDTRECDACVMDAGRRIGIDMQVGQLRVASTHFLKQAESVLVSCEEVAERMARHFRGLRTTITPWEDDALLKQASRLAARPVQRRGPRRVLIVGAIGADKGYDVLLGCVRDAARRQLNLAFTVVGYTMDDARLIDSGPIFITGAFDEAEAISLAAAQRADIGFIPSIWPETWCYTLSTIWRVGLSAVAFAFGAQAQRISRTGLGILLPVGLASERINDALLEYATAQQDPLRPASDPADNDAPVAGLHRKEDRENESEWPLLA